MKTCAAAVILMLIAFSTVVSAEEWYCGGMQLQSHSFGATSNNYVITYKCDYYETDGNDNARHDVFNVTFNGSYERSSLKATEHIDEHLIRYSNGDVFWDGHNYYNSSAVCDSDPWLAGGGCRGGTYSIQPPSYYPVVTSTPGPQSAVRLSAAARAALNQEYTNHSAAPKLVQPGNGEKYDFPGDIGIMVMHQTGRDIEFKIEWRPDAQHALQNVATSFITSGLGGVSLAPEGQLAPAGESGYEITTAKLHPHEKGEWTLRVKHQGASWWSDPVTFHVVEPLDSQPGQLNAPGQPLEQPVFHEPRVNHTYEVSEIIPIKITYRKGCILHYQFGVRAAGDTAPAKVLWQNSSGTGDNGVLVMSLPGIIMLASGSDVSEFVVKAWVERPPGDAQYYLVEKSETAERVVRVHSPKIEIKSPGEGQHFTAPAKISFVVPFRFEGVTVTPQTYSEILACFNVELEKLSTVTNLPNIFYRYEKSEPDGVVFGDLAMFRYQLTEPGTYRFRVRYRYPIFPDSYGGPWSDWRTITLSRQLPVIQKAGEPAELILQQKKELSPLQKKTVPAIAPVISSPAENQKFRLGGLLPLHFQGVDGSRKLLWQLEFKSFTGKAFRKQNEELILVDPSPSSTAIGKIRVRTPGIYRIRNRIDAPGSTWGPWRQFQVGEISVRKTPEAARDIRPAEDAGMKPKPLPAKPDLPAAPAQRPGLKETGGLKRITPSAPVSKPDFRKAVPVQ